MILSVLVNYGINNLYNLYPALNSFSMNIFHFSKSEPVIIKNWTGGQGEVQREIQSIC